MSGDRLSRRGFLAAVTVPAMGQTTRGSVIERTKDVVEVNRYYDGEAKLVFRQVIFWRWSAWFGEYHVDAWVIDDKAVPQYDHRRGLWVTFWRHKPKNRLYRYYTPMRRQTWTQYDPEQEDRKVWPVEMREGLPKN